MAAFDAVRNALPALARAAEAAAERLGRGGRLVYAGAGASGRLAVQDGVELHPAFGWPRATPSPRSTAEHLGTRKAASSCSARLNPPRPHGGAIAAAAACRLYWVAPRRDQA